MAGGARGLFSILKLSLVMRGEASLSRFVVSSFCLLVFHTRPQGKSRGEGKKGLIK